MRFVSSCASVWALAVLFIAGDCAFGQTLLPTKGWGSLSGTVTLDGKVEAPSSLVDKMNAHADKQCCLAGKPSEKMDQTWIVDPKTGGIANVMVWIKPPAGTYFPTAEQYKKRKEKIVLDQPHCAFIPHVAAFNPFYIDKGKETATGQTMVINNSATVNHNVRAIGHPEKNPGFNTNLPAGAELDVTKKLKPQPLPISVQCDVHPWMSAKLFVFDHPYYAITKEDGSFEIPVVPAGATVNVIAWHEGVGWALNKSKLGKEMMLQEGKNKLDFKVEAPK